MRSTRTRTKRKTRRKKSTSGKPSTTKRNTQTRKIMLTFHSGKLFEGRTPNGKNISCKGCMLSYHRPTRKGKEIVNVVYASTCRPLGGLARLLTKTRRPTHRVSLRWRRLNNTQEIDDPSLVPEVCKKVQSFARRHMVSRSITGGIELSATKEEIDYLVNHILGMEAGARMAMGIARVLKRR